jgi:hypothetical protein
MSKRMMATVALLIGASGCPVDEDAAARCVATDCARECTARGYGSSLCVGDICQCAGRPDGGGDGDGDVDADAGSDVDVAETDGDTAETDGDPEDGASEADGTMPSCPDEETVLALCTGRDMCFVGRFTITDNPDTVDWHPATNAFDELEGVPAVYVVAGDFLSAESSGWERGGPYLFHAAASSFGMTGLSPATCGSLVPALQGLAFDLRGAWASMVIGGAEYWLVDLPLSGAGAGESWSVTWVADGSPPIPWGPDSALSYRPFDLPGTLTLERSDGGGVTDRATGTCTLQSR